MDPTYLQALDYLGRPKQRPQGMFGRRKPTMHAPASYSAADQQAVLGAMPSSQMQNMAGVQKPATHAAPTYTPAQQQAVLGAMPSMSQQQMLGGVQKPPPRPTLPQPAPYSNPYWR